MGATNIEKKRYSTNDNSFIEEVNGNLPGKQYVNKDGILCRMIHTAFEVFDRANMIATLLYIQQIFHEDEWVNFRTLKTTVDGKEYIYGNIENQNTFGKRESDPWIIEKDEEGNELSRELKPDLVKENQFMDDVVLKNKYKQIISFDDFIYESIDYLISIHAK